jgi:hypothetical protein
VHRSHRCIGMVYPGTLFIGDNGAFLCIPMKIGVTFEHRRAPDPRRRRAHAGHELPRPRAADEPAAAAAAARGGRRGEPRGPRELAAGGERAAGPGVPGGAWRDA